MITDSFIYINNFNDTIDQNITKAKRASYSLMTAGLHRVNGLDPVTSISIMKTYILPILTYNLEVLQPRSSNIHKLEQFQKSVLNRILSLPKNAPDPVLYIISAYYLLRHRLISNV